MIFRNREEAARRLLEKLQHYRGRDPLILAIPRGAVPMGKILADELGGELDVALVRKLGAPGNPEYAIGAIDESGDITLRAAAWYERLPDGYIDAEAARQLAILHERRRRYTPERAAVDLRGRIVVIVDEGVATGATLRAALTLARRRRPERLVAAIGVAPRETLEEIEAAADETICLATPSPFFAVGQFYQDFSQVPDEQVISILRSRAGTLHVKAG